MKRRSIGIVNGIIASSSYGTNPLFALPLYSGGIGVNSVLFYRYAIAVLIYGLWLKIVKKMSFKLHKEEILPLLFLGIFFSLSSLTLFEAFHYIEAGIACTILFIYPILVALIMAIFFREKLTKTVIFAIFVTSLGICLLYNGKTGMSLNIHGIGLVLTSALLYALYIVGVKKIKAIQHVHRAKMSFYVMFFGLIVYIVNLKGCTQLQMLNNPILWLYTIGLALLPTIISLETINISIKLAGPTTTAILGALEPLTAIFFGVIFFNEQLTFRIIEGVTLILLGVLTVATRKQKIA